ncbi:acetate non-utilizing protein 9, mitochondrial, variant [Coccidioides immitis RS]|uniref:Succinate dehydrogenase assembly factor 3 n=1 Tax=Coccidioides immitis (strain RS) TaxID=246410 RepID=A0A0D8JVC4_COCIM|nr:acetate non-utilizing protein 9, mitochondrial, variant [Coccidioides immitis RS]KJF60218.1 acetate non-utilizing protein 9, mitochondrial, variant [Coccidioides immitis RS]
MKLAPVLRMASSPTITSASSLRPPLALLPPLLLYRRLLRAHRKLPQELRLLGDEYVKAEFRAHRNVGFLTEWQLYAQKLEGDSWRDEKLDKAKLEKMSDQQIGQLYELMQATKDAGDKDNGDS